VHSAREDPPPASGRTPSSRGSSPLHRHATLEKQHVCSHEKISTKKLLQSSYGHGKPGKVMDLKNVHLQAWKSPLKKNHKRFGQVMEMCYIHMFI